MTRIHSDRRCTVLAHASSRSGSPFLGWTRDRKRATRRFTNRGQRPRTRSQLAWRSNSARSTPLGTMATGLWQPYRRTSRYSLSTSACTQLDLFRNLRSTTRPARRFLQRRCERAQGSSMPCGETTYGIARWYAAASHGVAHGRPHTVNVDDVASIDRSSRAPTQRRRPRQLPRSERRESLNGIAQTWVSSWNVLGKIIVIEARPVERVVLGHVATSRAATRRSIHRRQVATDSGPRASRPGALRHAFAAAAASKR